MYHLPELPYSYDALEPHFDAQTMKVHHQGHHRTYVERLNAALEKYPEWQIPADDLMVRLDEVPAEVRTAVRDNGGGHANHSLFWNLLFPKRQEMPGGTLGRKMEDTFGGMTGFQEKFSKAAAEHFSNGWAWLVANRRGMLSVCTTPDHISPLSRGEYPLLVLDIWEHAYYLKHQNRRPEFIDAFWPIVHWREVERRWSRFCESDRNAA